MGSAPTERREEGRVEEGGVERRRRAGGSAGSSDTEMTLRRQSRGGAGVRCLRKRILYSRRGIWVVYHKVPRIPSHQTQGGGLVSLSSVPLPSY